MDLKTLVEEVSILLCDQSVWPLLLLSVFIDYPVNRHNTFSNRISLYILYQCVEQEYMYPIHHGCLHVKMDRINDVSFFAGEEGYHRCSTSFYS